MIDLSDVQDDGYAHGTGGHAEGDKLRDIQDIIGLIIDVLTLPSTV